VGQKNELETERLVELLMMKLKGDKNESIRECKDVGCIIKIKLYNYRLCSLEVRIPAYRSRGPRFDSQRYQII
jgi:hypothetical protein